MRASRESLQSLGRRLPQLAAELDRLADSLESGNTGTLDDIRRLLHDVVTGMCIEEKVEVPGFATTRAMLDALVERRILPMSIATPLVAIDARELTLTGDATRAMITFLEWRVGSRSGTRPGRRPSRRPLVIALVAAIAVVIVAVIVVVARRGERDVELVAGELVVIPGGTFEMGSTGDEQRAVCEELGCDAEEIAAEQLREVTISTFELDRHEVTVGELVQWLNRARPAGVTGLPNVEHGADGVCTVKPENERLPATGVTWEVARAYCEAVGKRLPTEAEWELAARGTQRRMFPWGAERPTCEEVVFGRKIGLACETFPQEQPTIVTNAPRDVTPEGVHDLGGNVSEWTACGMGERPRCSGPCRNPRIEHGAERIVRGGHFRSVPSQLRGASRVGLDPERSHTNVGFRCAR